MNAPMLRRLVIALLVIALPPWGLAWAETACLPRVLFPKGESEPVPALELGLVAGVPTMCARRGADRAELLGCWSINPANGALSASSATSFPGHSLRGEPDAQGCIEGYCMPPPENADDPHLWATSTSGTKAVLLRERFLHVFDASSKAQTRVIALNEDNAPDGTNVSNQPVKLLYVGDTIYVVGTDAGPFKGVWSFKETGERLGIVTMTGKPGSEALSVYLGAAQVIDSGHVLLSDAGLRQVVVLTPSGPRQDKRRAVSTAPCTKDELQIIDLGDLDPVSKACRRTAAANIQPYFDLVPVRLPSGDLLAAFAGKLRGSLAVLDGNTLREKKRLKLARCK